MEIRENEIFKDWLFESTLHIFTRYVSEENIDIPLPIFLLEIPFYSLKLNYSIL